MNVFEKIDKESVSDKKKYFFWRRVRGRLWEGIEGGGGGGGGGGLVNIHEQTFQIHFFSSRRTPVHNYLKSMHKCRSQTSSIFDHFII